MVNESSRSVRTTSYLGALLCLGALSGAMRPAGAQTITAPVAPAAVPAPASVCDAAGAEAERRYDLPGGLLRAIGRVESGRRDPATGQVSPWPWTINAEGKGKLFDTQEQALTATRTLQRSGVASIDVGCYQVNLIHHPTAFPALEDGFDPSSNAAYAARFLQTLRAKTGSWEAAVAAYHSATPERGGPYRDRVLAGWARDGSAPGGAMAAIPPAPTVRAGVPLVVRMVTWTPPPTAGGQMRIWTPSPVGQGAAIIAIPQASPVARLASARLPRG